MWVGVHVEVQLLLGLATMCQLLLGLATMCQVLLGLATMCHLLLENILVSTLVNVYTTRVNTCLCVHSRSENVFLRAREIVQGLGKIIKVDLIAGTLLSS